MSEVKVNKITPRTNCGTTTLGDSGDTFNIPAGVTISNNGTATGFGATGAVNWDVSSIKTVDFTATAGVGYFVDTATTGAVEVTLPGSPSVGDVVGVADYANNFATANCTLNRNSLKIGGTTVNAILEVSGVAVTLVYVDVTKGWIVTDSGNQTDAPTATYIAATGGCITTCGNYKVHTFNSPGTFTVTSVGNPAGSNEVDYLIVGGAGGGGWCIGGGGGAGGVRISAGTSSGCYTVNPLGTGVAAVPVSTSPGSYPIVVGGGGSAAVSTCVPSTSGNNSSALCLTAAYGGAGGGWGRNGVPGGSGGGTGGWTLYPGTDPGGGVGGSSGGTGNQPPVSPPQGNTGGSNSINTQDSGGAGGGGATGVGANSTSNPARTQTSAGGTGITTNINFSSVTYATGGDGKGDTATGAAAGGCNTGDGGDGSGNCSPGTGKNGGSGVVIIRYKYQ